MKNRSTPFFFYADQVFTLKRTASGLRTNFGEFDGFEIMVDDRCKFVRDGAVFLCVETVFQYVATRGCSVYLFVSSKYLHFKLNFTAVVEGGEK